DVASYDEAGAKAIAQACEAAQTLPSDGWLQRLAEGNPFGPLEALLAAVRATTYARDESGGQEMGYGIETEAAQLDGNFVELAQQAASALAGIRQPLIKLGLRLEAIAEDAPDWLDAQGRARIEGARHSLAWRIDTLAAWEALLERLGGPADPDFVDWLTVERSDAREFDIGPIGIRQPLIKLGLRLEAIAEDAPDWLDAQGRARIEGARHSLAWRIDTLAAWEALLERLGGPADPDFVDWLTVERSDAREFDIG